jgi:hypothetical protein
MTTDYFYLPSFLRKQESSATRGKMDSRFHGNDVGDDHFLWKKLGNELISVCLNQTHGRLKRQVAFLREIAETQRRPFIR